MPLFMDFHKGLNITVEDVKKAHIADQRVQDKYGVKYHQFWVNEEAGTIFCLMEGPDKESCEAVHREAHGNIACTMIEVETGFYKLFMGEGHHIEHGLVHHDDGTPDLGYRNVLVVTIRGISSPSGLLESRYLSVPHAARKWILAAIRKFSGREVECSTDDGVIGVFTSSDHAVRCALDIQRELIQRRNMCDQEWNVSFKIGLSAGQPITEHDDFFGEAIKLARRLCNIAREKQVLISSLVSDLCDVAEIIPGPDERNSIRSLNTHEESFITSLFKITEANLANDNFTIDRLSRAIGMSRPQLYRKIITLTGRSPNDLIRDLRMDKAFSLLKRKSGNVSEIALEVGYSNPSYFAKCFTKKFGCTPSKFMEAASSFV